jgi:hypothetical protein
MKLKLFVSITSCFLFIKSYSQDPVVWDKKDSTWEWVGVGGNSVYLIKKTYETKSDEEVTFWIKVLNSATKAKGKTIKAATIEKILYGFDCNEKTLKIMAYVKYTLAGKVISSKTLEDYEQKSVNVVPETIGEMLFLKACSMQ